MLSQMHSDRENSATYAAHLEVLHHSHFDFAVTANTTHPPITQVEPHSLVQRLSRLANLVMTSGETYGDPQMSDAHSLRYTGQIDAIEFESLDNVNDLKHSIWYWIHNTAHSPEGPDPVEFMRFYRENQSEFLALHKYDMLLERGFNGESILCYALLYSKLSNLRLAKFILGIDDAKDPLPKDRFPADLLHQIINLTYESELYHGEHACHIVAVKFKDEHKEFDKNAVPNNDQSAVFWMKHLIEAGADIAIPRARGSFFSIDEVYLGETVLAFAACCGNYMLVDYLINEVGVDPSCTDSYGNNVLHVLCHWGIYDSRLPADSTDSTSGDSVSDSELEAEKKYGALVPEIKDDSIFALLCDKHSHYSISNLDSLHKKVDDSTVNLEKDTPLLVAIRRGNHKMVQAYLNFKGKIMWEFGPIKCTRYDLTEIDTYVDAKTMNHSTGGLTIAVSSKHIEILKLPIFRELLAAKWRKYGLKKFQLAFMTHIATMLFFTAMLVLLPNDASYFQNPSIPPSRFPSIPKDLGANIETSVVSIVRAILEFVVLGDNIRIAWHLCHRFFFGRKMFYNGFGRAENSAQLMRVVIFICGAFCHCVPSAWQAENFFWGVYALVGWFEVFFYFRAMVSLGPLIVVVVEVLSSDVSRFMRIAALFIIAFAEAFWLQMAPGGDVQYDELYNSVNGTIPASAGGAEWGSLVGAGWWTLRNFLIPGSSAYSDFRLTPIPVVAILAYLIFTFVVLVLINVFIAMVGSTFSRITKMAEDQCLLLRAQLILEYDERLLPKHYTKLERARLADKQAENPYLSVKQENNDAEKSSTGVSHKDPVVKQIDQLDEVVTRIGVPRPLERDDTEELQALKEGKLPHGSKCFYEMFIETEHRFGRVKVRRVVSSKEEEDDKKKKKKLRRAKEIKKSRRSRAE
ncbi:hypothetical protein HDU84_006441 [Entophlyctis sp. JEL0112]|nr:hypothetical protein HDU84_006441 [Entophlyctis sp. JEL0112]